MDRMSATYSPRREDSDSQERGHLGLARRLQTVGRSRGPFALSRSAAPTTGWPRLRPGSSGDWCTRSHDPELPFLGVHFTRRVDGEVWAGPSAVLALAREGSRPWQVNVPDLASTLGFGGFWRLAGRHWRTGLEEIRRDLSGAAFIRACRRYLPDLRPEHLVAGPFGVRAQAVNRDGSLEDDFSLAEGDGVLHVRNAPSPGATASLAIGRMLGSASWPVWTLPDAGRVDSAGVAEEDRDRAEIMFRHAGLQRPSDHVPVDLRLVHPGPDLAGQAEGQVQVLRQQVETEGDQRLLR
jgi:hypothetical protein